jgi:transcriptional regulator with XRE-family HTH domain
MAAAISMEASMNVFDLSEELPLSPAVSAEAESVELLNRRVIEAFATRLADRRITKKQLAERMGLDKSEVSRLLRGESNLTARKFGRVLWALEYAYDIVLHDTQKDKTNQKPTQFRVSFKTADFLDGTVGNAAAHKKKAVFRKPVASPQARAPIARTSAPEVHFVGSE